jgi:hypothetical protein
MRSVALLVGLAACAPTPTPGRTADHAQPAPTPAPASAPAPAPAPTPAPPPAPAPAPPPAPTPIATCATPINRGARQRKSPLVGQPIEALDRRGGSLLCRRGAIWQFRFGTLCGNLASFHRVVTVEVRAGKVRQVWARERHNDAFCGEPSF